MQGTQIKNIQHHMVLKYSLKIFLNFYFIYLFLAAPSLCCFCTGFLWLHEAAATPRCGGFCCRAQALGAQAPVVAAHGLQSVGSVAAHRLSCSAPCGILVPGPENEPLYPAFQGEFFFLILIGRKLHSVQGAFLTTGPQGKSQ